MKKKFLIFAPPYRETDGGGIVLHRLCALLRELDYEAYLTRSFNGMPVYQNDFVKPLYVLIKRAILRFVSPFKTNSAWDTPILKTPDTLLGPEWVVIYPEITFGNPLRAQNVVRWFLYQPGFHTGMVFYGPKEFHVDFNLFASDFNYPGCYKSEFPLNVLSFPFEYYNLDGAVPEELRVGTAYCLRKGKEKKIQHDLSDSILIDGKSHAEVSKIFKRVKRFISYDAYTAYSSFAVLCGAESVVIPDPGGDKTQWYPDPADRYGVAYGFDDFEEARVTADKVLPRMKDKERRSLENVQRFADEIHEFFRN